MGAGWIWVRRVLDDRSTLRFGLLMLVVVACGLCGGSFNAAMPSLIFLRPVLIVTAAAGLLVRGGWRWEGLALPFAILLLLAATMLVQLVPLPIDWWLAMPGHDRYRFAVAATGARSEPWSLSPDATINSLLALLPAAVTMLLYAGLRDEHRSATLWLIVGLSAASAAVGVVTVAAGSEVANYASDPAQGALSGLLANRNHEAVLLAITIPVLLAIAQGSAAAASTPVRLAMLGGAVLTLPLILLTGSRQGTAIGLLAGLVTLILWVASRPKVMAGRRDRLRIAAPTIAAVVVVVAVAAAAVMSGRAVSLQRLAHGDVANDLRLQNLPSVLLMLRTFLPFGIGQGAFDPVYRGFEPDGTLIPTYFNHAHNDLLEFVLDGGIPAGIVLALFLGWYVYRSASSFRTGSIAPAARAGAIAIGAVLLSSLVDYPLRTAIMSMAFALACCWLGAPPRATASQSRRSRKRTDRWEAR